MKPKAVLFDLDGTLFDRDTCFLALVQDQYEAFREPLAHIARETYIQRVVELDAHGYVDKVNVYRDVAREFGLATGMADRLRMHFHETYDAYCQSFPEAVTSLQKLRRSGFKIGIITNGSVASQERKIRQLGIAEIVDAVLISEREGMRKPDARIFEKAVARLGMANNEAWFVGDHPVSDVRGAFDAGLIPVWKYTPYWPTPDVPALQIQTLDELVEILEREQGDSEMPKNF